MIIAVTGHRPNKLWGYNTARPQYAQVAKALGRVIDHLGADTLITGMALGFDQIAAEVAKDRDDVRFVAAVPFKDQPSRWPYISRHHYFQLLDAADEIDIVCEGEYEPQKMQVRNEWMVDHADVIVALWDGTPGGTRNCLAYAAKQAKPVFRMDPRSVTPDSCPGFLPANEAARTLAKNIDATPIPDDGASADVPQTQPQP